MSDKKTEEVWLCTTDSQLWLVRTDGLDRLQIYPVQGKNRRVRVTERDRVRMMEDSPNTNPFTNGLLVPLDEGGKPTSPAPLADELFQDASDVMLPDELMELTKKRQPNLGRKLAELSEINFGKIVSYVESLGDEAPAGFANAVKAEWQSRSAVTPMADPEPS